MTPALDTHRMIKRLTEAGFSEPQAETVVDVVRESQGADFASLATKADLTNGLAEFRLEFRSETGRLETLLAKDKADLLKWLIGVFLVQVGVIAGLLKLLAGH